LPATAAVGALTTHIYGVITLSAYLPVSSPQTPGLLRDINNKPLFQPLPDRFIVADGGCTRAFIGVDKRPGTALSAALDGLVREVRAATSGNRDRVLDYVRTAVGRWLAATPGAATGFTGAELPWDLGTVCGAEGARAYATVARHTPRDLPIATTEQRAVVPFERWLQHGKGYCIQKALLASFVLERFNIAHRIVHGATVSGMATTGHTWIELQDGRVLDPAWALLANKGPRDPGFPELFLFGGSYRFASSRYLYLVIP
jgi:hypothetical protein